MGNESPTVSYSKEVPCPSITNSACPPPTVDVFLQSTFPSLLSHGPTPTHLVRFTEPDTLISALHKLKVKLMPEFLKRRTFQRLLLTAFGRVDVGTAMLVADQNPGLPRADRPTGGYIHGFTEASLLTQIWYTSSSFAGSQNALQLDVLRRLADLKVAASGSQGRHETVVLVVRVTPNEVKIILSLLFLAFVLSVVIGTCTSSLGNGLAVASALFALFSSIHPLCVLIRGQL
ncbi:hypothetical protein BGZ61DRAFT_460815, partial [Ilyonectria robusta]|uniref:uncharacterized protein n=1 Tax=Ilyonectria robusta TaxID=1079257 RepID=UPI001E8D6193